MPKGYRVTVVDPDGVVLDTFSIDGYDLTSASHRATLGERIEDGMGRTHVDVCAKRYPSDEDED